jgi:hypothetical protein
MDFPGRDSREISFQSKRIPIFRILIKRPLRSLNSIVSFATALELRLLSVHRDNSDFERPEILFCTSKHEIFVVYYVIGIISNHDAKATCNDENHAVPSR